MANIIIFQPAMCMADTLRIQPPPNLARPAQIIPVFGTIFAVYSAPLCPQHRRRCSAGASPWPPHRRHCWATRPAPAQYSRNQNRLRHLLHPIVSPDSLLPSRRGITVSAQPPSLLGGYTVSSLSHHPGSTARTHRGHFRTSARPFAPTERTQRDRLLHLPLREALIFLAHSLHT